MEERITKQEFLIGVIIAIGLILLCGVSEAIIG